MLELDTKPSNSKCPRVVLTNCHIHGAGRDSRSFRLRRISRNNLIPHTNATASAICFGSTPHNHCGRHWGPKHWVKICVQAAQVSPGQVPQSVWQVLHWVWQVWQVAWPHWVLQVLQVAWLQWVWQV